MYKNPEHTGNNWKRVSTYVGVRIFKHFMHLMVNRLLESDRVILRPGVSMFIGTIKNNPDSIAKRHKKKQIYWENPGYRYGLVVWGAIEHEYFFRMPARRRQELVLRIKEGQSFHNQLEKGSIVHQ